MKRQRDYPSSLRLAVMASGLFLSLTVLVLGLRQVELEGAVDLLFGVGFSVWAGLPFFILGRAKTFRRWPAVVLILWLVGLAVMVRVTLLVISGGHGSTAALALLWMPGYLLVLYLIAMVVLHFLPRRT